MQGLKLAVALTIAIASISVAAQTPALRLVVIEGEDAVNIIQQNTAVRPVVEVRDRNNLPVAGALVTFSIEGGKAASFGGASTLTVATNAAGQAAVTGLTPSAAGAFQIQVSAAFQGQVATATIAQTNVMTAAQAAAAGATSASGASSGSGASGASSASGASGAGGGLSTTTIAVAGAAVAGGAVAATQLTKSEDDGADTFTGSFSGPVVSTIVSRNSGNTCSITRSVTGTATLTFDRNDGTNVSGRLEVQGTDTVVSSGCPVTNPSTSFNGTTTVTGTTSVFRGSEGRNETGTGVGGETIQGTSTMFFEGSLNGNTVTGTMRWEQKSVSTGGAGGPVDQLASGTFTLTLTRS
ncbi:MAG TPA: hypothetical protein VFZ31_17170 [Vicinamibacterales bacterium]